jgi:hypothetical protein
MQIVINIDNDLYKSIINHRYKIMYQQKCDYEDLKNAIEDGVPIPKGHGRLGDLDALREEVSSWGMNDYEPSDFIDAIDQVDTIIEADRSEEE